jgi:hypothetical protein
MGCTVDMTAKDTSGTALGAMTATEISAAKKPAVRTKRGRPDVFQPDIGGLP